MTYKWNGRKIYNPLGILAMIAIGFPLVVVTLLVTSPITVPLHFALKRMGRKAFMRYEGRSAEIVLDRTGFERA